MKISHAAMYVSDLEKSKEFYIKYFGAVPNEKYRNPKTGLETYFLTFDGYARLEIMQRPDTVPCEKAELAEGFSHLAFGVGSRDNVDRLTEQLRADGFIVAGEPRITGDGYYESVVLDSDGNRIEITV